MRVSVTFCLLVFGITTLSFAGEPARLTANVQRSGGLTITEGNQPLFQIELGAFAANWQMTSATAPAKYAISNTPERNFSIRTATGAVVNGVATYSEQNGAVGAKYQFTPASDVSLHTLHASAEFPVAALAGAKWTAGDKNGKFPDAYKDAGLFSGEIKTLSIELPRGLTLTWTFHEPTQVLLQDNRQWGPTVSVRIGPQGEKNYKKGETVKLGFNLSATGGIAMSWDQPVTITAGPEWVPLNLQLDIEAGSALDFSNMGLLDAPAGKFGRVIARPDGQFAFEKDPQTARRFYGVNFCFSALYISHEDADRLADRLMRLGYNAVRVHHYEGELVSGQPNSTTLNSEKLDQLDYLLAAFAKRGLYITTDLFVSRPVPNKEVGIDRPGNVEMDTYKILVPVVPAAYENFKAFSKALLDHVNPYTKLRYADDPALAWLSMINEGMFGNFMDKVRKVPEWTLAWNKYLEKQYPSRGALAAAWKNELKDSEDQTKGTVELPTNIYAGGARVGDCHSFFAATDREMIAKMRKFLTEELKCKALITNANAWTNFLSDQASRMTYDYVDDHFYVDHPHFLEQPWRLPSKCDNTSPISGGATGGRYTTFTRLFDKPFTITEYNYSCPGRFRGVGGILTGALGAIQNWGGIWRFAYCHSRDNELQPRPMNYFDMVTDPLGQASERASLCLFVRGDMKPAPHAVSVATTEQEALTTRPMPKLAPNWHWLAWVTKVGTQIGGDPKSITALLPAGEASRTAAGPLAALQAYQPDVPALMDLLKSKGILSASNPTDPTKNIFQSETGEITIDAGKNVMLLDTPRTAGGYAPAGQSIVTADKGVSISIQDSDATVWVSALDKEPISKSKRLLVTHLTDLQNTDIKYGEKARQTLLDWGKLPHLVRAGKAKVIIKNSNPNMKVWALSTSGKRIGEVPRFAERATRDPGIIEFTADVAGDAQGGARMCYEIGEK
ncbi:MAG TPA: hypothetical protein VGP72_08655 [Planctomycetota bacterium]|jgi:hypothetical protein